MTSTISLEQVSKWFGSYRALDSIGLDVEAGSFVTLLGPSGSGKSTTLRVIGGFETPDTGRVLLDGEDITALPPEARNINTSFQGYALFPHMTVAQNVAFGLEARGVSRPEIVRRVQEALDLVQLGTFGSRSVAYLSGGEQQRIALARAFVNRPKVLLLDEPLSALDLKLRRRMQIELKELQRALQMTFIYVTHDQEEALSMSDRIVVMNRARIEQVGAPAEVYHRPRTAFVAEFLGEANILTGTVISVTEGRTAALMVDGITMHVAADAGIRLDDRVTVSLRPESIEVGAAAERMENHLSCEVIDSVFLGNAHELILRAGALRLKAWMPAHALRKRVVVGSVASVGWATEDMVLVA